MPICYVNPDGSHVKGCIAHQGEHPYDWCHAGCCSPENPHRVSTTAAAPQFPDGRIHYTAPLGGFTVTLGGQFGEQP